MIQNLETVFSSYLEGVVEIKIIFLEEKHADIFAQPKVSSHMLVSLIFISYT